MVYKKERIAWNKGKHSTEEHCRKISIAVRKYYANNEVSEETRKKLSISHMGKTISKENIEKMRLGRLKNKGGLSEEHKKNISISMQRYIAKFSKSEEYRKKLSLAHSSISQETKIKMSMARKGRKLTEETKRKIREKRKYQIITEETKKKISLSKLGTIPWNKGNRGGKHTEEHKRNIRLASPRKE